MAKYFGELIINEAKNNEDINIKFIGHDILFYLPDWIINDRNKVKRCLEIMDTYIEMDYIARKSIITNYPQIKKFKMNSKYHFINMENNKSIEFFGHLNDDRRNIIEELMNKELKILGDE
jgi:hypothetical protein